MLKFRSSQFRMFVGFTVTAGLSLVSFSTPVAAKDYRCWQNNVKVCVGDQFSFNNNGRRVSGQVTHINDYGVQFFTTSSNGSRSDVLMPYGSMQNVTVSPPAGSYRLTCQNFTVDGNRLNAQCWTWKRRSLVQTHLDYWECVGDISNNRGRLQCPF